MNLPDDGPAARILVYGDARLRRVSRDVAAGEDVNRLVDGMLGALQAAGGVGLAAPQVGDLRRVIVCRDPGSSAAPVVMVNPVILAREGPRVGFEEGCLSFPGLYLTLPRPQGIEVRYEDRDGRTRTLRDRGLLARIIQHEVDHLDGVLFCDHLPPWRRWLLAGRLRRLRRQEATA